MLIRADSSLIEKIKKEEKMSLYVFSAISFIVIMYSIFMYFRDNGIFFLVEIAIFLIIACLFLYVAIIRQAKLIANTIVEIVADSNNLKFRTTAFKMLSFYKIECVAFEVSKRDLILNSTDYPLERTFKTKRKVYKLIFEDQAFYFLPEYFDSSVLIDCGLLK